MMKTKRVLVCLLYLKNNYLYLNNWLSYQTMAWLSEAQILIQISVVHGVTNQGLGSYQ